MERTVLITGGLGFIGAKLTTELVSRGGTRVVVVDNEFTGCRRNLTDETLSCVDLVTVDLSDGDATRAVMQHTEPDVVLHLAAIHFIPLCNDRPDLAVRMNVLGTANLLAAARALANPPVVAFASTAAVYGPMVEAATEQAIPDPDDIYGRTKLWGEQLMDLYRSESGANTAILRLFNAVGEAETNPHLIPSILAGVICDDPAGEGAKAEKRVLRLGNLSTSRDYVYVGDVARAFADAPSVVADRGSICVNVCTGVASSGFEVIEAIGVETAKNYRVEVDSARVRASDRPMLLGSNDRFANLFGWRPTTDLRKSVRAALAQPFAPSYARMPGARA